MVDINTPNNWEESVENPNKKKNGNIHDLLIESIQSSLCLKDSELLDPKIYNKYANNIDALRQIVKDEMKLRAGKDGFSEITESDVGTYSHSKILYALQSKIGPLKAARERAKSVCERTFTDLYSIVPEGDFDNQINLMDEITLWKILYSRITMYQFFQEYFGISRDQIQAKVYQFKDITENIPAAKKQETQNAIIQYQKYGTPIPKYILENLFVSYGTTPAKRKILCETFDIDFTIRDAFTFWLITEASFEDYVRWHITKDVWDKLEKNEQEMALSAYRKTDSIRLKIGNLDGPELWNLLSDRALRSLMSTEAGYNLAQSIMIGTKKTWSIYSKLIPNTEWKYHSSFLELIQKEFGEANKIKGIDNLRVWWILVFLSENNTEEYIQITNIDVPVPDPDMPDGTIPGIELAYLNGRTKWTVGLPKWHKKIGYDAFYDMLSNIQTNLHILSGDTFDSYKGSSMTGLGILQDEAAQLKDVSLDETNHTLEWLVWELDSIDPEGKTVWFKVGTAFTAKWQLDNGEEYEWVWTIKTLNENNIIIQNGRYEEEEVTYKDFASVAGSQNLRRIENVGDDTAMIHALKSFGIDDHAKIDKKWDIVSHREENDGHGHHKEVATKFEFFQSEAGGHIRIWWFKNGQVFFGEFATTGLEKIQKAGNAGKLSDKQKHSFYDWQTMSYGQFLQYLKKSKLKATTENLLHPDATSRYKPQEPHLEGSLLSKMGQMWSVADIIKWFGNLTHAVEHYFEKTSKLNASRVALAMGRKMWLSKDILAQLQADEVGSIKEIIEKYQEKLRNLNGPDGRNKALHMAHNKNARPEEVAAAMLHMLKWYGQLYAEDIAYAQWSESFITWFMNACGYTGDGLIEQKKKARDKAKTMIGDEGEDPREPTEEEMIWAFCKSMDGAYGENPIAATVVKAMGWPSGYEAAWRKDGTMGAIEKWVRQAGDLVNARARWDHGLSALMTHEYHTAIGSMQSTASKTPHPAYQTIPIVWALGGYSQYLSTKWHGEIKKYADGMGHSMHAFAFLRTHEDNKTYKDVFELALKDVASQTEVDKLNSWIHELEKDGHTPPNKEKKEKITAAVNGIADIWRKYNSSWLHDNLQWKNTWLIEKANTNEAAKKYLKRFNEIHQNNDGDTPHSPDNDWYIQMGYAFSPLIESVEVEGQSIQTLWRTLKKVKINSQSMNFSDKNHIERFWNPAIEKVLELKKSQNTKLQRLQYFQYRKDIIKLFNDSVWAYYNGRPNWLAALKSQWYARDFTQLGIDPAVIFTTWDFDMRVDRTAEADYQRFLGTTTSSYSTKSVDTYNWAQQKLSNILTGVQNPSERTRQWPIDPDEFQPTPWSGGAIYETSN